MKKQKNNINYQSIFFMGISFVGLGVVFIAAVNEILGVSFMIIGILNMIIGAKNKDKWPKK
jgi:hypothetical protein